MTLQFKGDSVMNVGEYIKKLRIESGYSQEQLGNLLGVQRAAVQKWECGRVQNLKRETIKKLAEIFDVSPSTFIDAENYYEYCNIIPLPNMNRIPLLGNIACGEPILAEENIECDIDIPEDINADFALRCKGDSMIDARILDGDIVYIKQQPTVNNGEIAAVLIGDEATLKKVYLTGDTLTLLACNSSYEPFVYSGTELENIRIIGKAVGFTSKI